MGVLIDVLGAVIIGGLLLMMLITFQYQLTETAERQMYAASMASHMEQASTRLNHVIGLAGLGIENPDEAVAVARDTLFVFRSYWDFRNNNMGPTSGDPNYISIGLYDHANQAMGKAIEIRQGTDADVSNDAVLENMGYIFWVDQLRFQYFRMGTTTAHMDELTTDKAKVRAANLFLTFRRDAPRVGSRALTNRLQLKCFLMNTYLQEGT